MSDFEQFKKLLEKSDNDFKEFKGETQKYLCFSDPIDRNLVMVARFKNEDDQIIDMYCADGISSIDEFGDFD
jgi:hypothetical protein